jgi:hypothetical protein
MTGETALSAFEVPRGPYCGTIFRVPQQSSY